MTPCLLVKPGVRFDRIAPAGFKILAILQQATYIFDRDLTITCGTEGHGPDDPHTEGAAFDIRSAGMADATILALLNYLRTNLGPAFTVLYETPVALSGVLGSASYLNPRASAAHFHIQLAKTASYP